MSVWILLACVPALTACGVCARWAWLDHTRHDPWLDVRRAMQKEAKKDLRRALKRIRKSRKTGTMDDLNWMRELRGERL